MSLISKFQIIKRPFWPLIILIIFGLNACTPIHPSSLESTTQPGITESPSVTALPAPSPTPTLTEQQLMLVATYWASDPYLPILTYHHFKNDNPEDQSDSLNVKYGDFRSQLQALYDAGYTLVPLETWIKGDLTATPGRRPLVLSLDDLYFADQLFLNEDGTPSNRSGLGILWEFYQEHPDFGYSAALFYNLGDKLYGNIETPTSFIQGDGWEEAQAKVIVWGIEHDLMPYNHFYKHPLLSKLDDEKMLYQYQQNEIRMKQLLTMAGRAELFKTLGNMLALPFGAWPGTEYMNEYLVGMPSQTRKPLLAVFEIDYAIRAKYMPPPYSAEFNRYHVPRLVADGEAVQLLVDIKDQFPIAQQCELGVIDKSEADDTGIIRELILTANQSGQCPGVIYVVDGKVFEVRGGSVSELTIPEP